MVVVGDCMKKFLVLLSTAIFSIALVASPVFASSQENQEDTSTTQTSPSVGPEEFGTSG